MYIRSLILWLFLITMCCGANPVCLIRIEPLIENNEITSSVGSGFFVKDNKVLTAYHVVKLMNEKYGNGRIEHDNKIIPFKIVKYDKERDVAILDTGDYRSESHLNFTNERPVSGDKVSIQGHPSGRWGVHTSTGEFRDSIFLDNIKFYSSWMDIRGGMSGGPLLNANGNAIGVLCMRNEVIEDGNLVKVRSFCISNEEIEDFLKE